METGESSLVGWVTAKAHFRCLASCETMGAITRIELSIPLLVDTMGKEAIRWATHVLCWHDPAAVAFSTTNVAANFLWCFPVLIIFGDCA